MAKRCDDAPKWVRFFAKMMNGCCTLLIGTTGPKFEMGSFGNFFIFGRGKWRGVTQSPGCLPTPKPFLSRSAFIHAFRLLRNRYSMPVKCRKSEFLTPELRHQK